MNRRYLLVMLAVCLLVGGVQAWGEDFGAWDYRKEITVNNTGSNLTNYQVLFTVNRSAGSDSGFTTYLNGKCESDYDDIRFTTGENTPCDYWIESSSSTVASIWVEVPSIVNSTAYGSTTMYLYYGNSGASAVSNGTNTFDFFDDFPGSSVDGSKWTDTKTGGTISVSGGRLSISGDIGAGKGLVSKSTFGSGTIIETMMTGIAGVNGGLNFGYGFYPASNTITVLDDTGSNNNLALYSKDTSLSYNTIGSQYTSDKRLTLERRSDTSQVATYAAYGSISHTRTISSSVAFVIGSHTAEIVGPYSFDWVLIRKYTATEPTVSAWGSEETPIVRSVTSAFSALPLTGNIPLTVYFTDASTGNNCTIDSWQWSFGDSSPNSTQQNPAHTYTTTGLFNVILTAFNTSYSKEDTEAKTAYINATANLDAPNADFTVTETCGDTTDTFYFIDFSTGGGLYAWNWSFGDGAYSELRNPTHQYAGNGTYDVNLTVWGAYGVDSLLRSNLIAIPCGAPTPTPTATVTPTETHTHIYGNISVYKVDSNYIVWRVSENVTSMCLDGEIVDVFGEYYGQYNLEPNTKHFACINTNECMSVITPDNGITVFGNWIIYLILIAACIIAVRVPILGTFPVVFGMYLITVYLPDIGATFAEYSLVGILVIMGIICAIIGFRRI